MVAGQGQVDLARDQERPGRPGADRRNDRKWSSAAASPCSRPTSATPATRSSTSPPGCFLHHQGSFITDFFVKANPDLKPGDDFNFFPFPDIDPQYAGAVEVAGDLFGMFRDTPQARALMKYLATPEAQAIWVKRGGALSPNKAVAARRLPRPDRAAAGQTLTTAPRSVALRRLRPDARGDEQRLLAAGSSTSSRTRATWTRSWPTSTRPTRTRRSYTTLGASGVGRRSHWHCQDP